MADALARGNPGEFTVNSSRYARPVYECPGFVAGPEPVDSRGVVTIPLKRVLEGGENNTFASRDYTE